MKFEHPFNDRYYDEQPFLTAWKCNYPKHKPIKDYVDKYNAKTCVITFCNNLKNILDAISDNVVEVDYIQAGEDHHTIYAIDDVLFVVPFVGGSCAVALIEELAVFGVKNFLACGSAGLIDSSFDSKKLYIVTDAIRDEGASYHYAPAEEKAVTDKDITEAIEKVFIKNNVSYDKGTTWTTDAFYREVPSLIEKRINQGAIAVDMECSAWCIVAKHLGVKFGQFLYFSDVVDNKDWSLYDKDYRYDLKDKMTILSYEIAQEIKQQVK